MKAFKLRSTEPELMDDIQIDPVMLHKVLKDISMANQLLGGNRITEQKVLQILKETRLKEPTITDIGCGDGTMLRRLANRLRKQGIKTKFVGLDLNESAITLARKHSEMFPEITYICGDFLKKDAKQLMSDIVLCTLTLHHIPSPRISQFLSRLAGISRKAVIVNDLHRSPWAYYLFKLFSVIFMKTDIAKHDGLVSIKRGFKRKEILQFTNDITGYNKEIQWRWAFRYLLTLRPLKNFHTNE